MRPRPKSVAASAALVAVIVIALLTASNGLTGSARAAVGSHRLGVAPTLPRGARRLSHLANTTMLSVDVALTPRDATALSAYAAGVSTPGSSDYRRYLTVGQFRARFAATASQIAAVRTALRAAGLHPSRVSANGLLIRIRASAGALSRAFHTSLERVRLAGGRIGYANRQAPQVSASIAGLVQGIVGLSSLEAPHALGLVRAKGTGHGRANARRAAETATVTSAPAPCAAASSTAQSEGGYTADEIASAYGFSSLYGASDFGAGQTVALMEFEEYSSSDIATYEACYGINGGSASNVSTVNVDGGVGPSYTGGTAGSGEAALDIEQVVGLAPAAAVDVYEAPDSEQGMLDAFTDMVDNASVGVISTSWGECESVNGSAAETAEATIFEEAAAVGKSVYAAAGDTGSSDCDGEVSGSRGAAVAVDDPGSQPYVTDVGGTSLPSDSDTAGQSVWNDSDVDGGNGAGGGGVSLEWTMPNYQSGAASSLGVINADSSSSACAAASGSYCREVPDVSADADPQTGYIVTYSGEPTPGQTTSWQAIGGTSAAAPLWAALTALANASSSCTGTAIGFANPVLYGVADDASEYASAFTDVSTGDNDYTPAGYNGGLYPAAVGYDMATGLGTPNAATLVPDMCSYAGGHVSSTTVTTATTPTTTTTASTPASTPQTTPAPVVTTATTPTTSSSATTKVGCALTASLRRTAYSLALNMRHRSASLSIPFNLPASCARDTLTVSRHVATTERRGAKALDTLKIQLLNGSGSVLSTLATLSNRNAAHGSVKLTVNLTRYAGRWLTLRFLATRSGDKTTTFTLSSVSLRLT